MLRIKSYILLTSIKYENAVRWKKKVKLVSEILFSHHIKENERDSQDFCWAIFCRVKKLKKVIFIKYIGHNSRRRKSFCMCAVRRRKNLSLPYVVLPCFE